MLDPMFIGPVFPCKAWHKCKNSKGYGKVSLGGGREGYIHRVTWTEHFGEPPAGQPCVLHRCDERDCYEITHLWVGTKAENNADARAKGRHGTNGYELKTHCRHGHAWGENPARRPDGSRRCYVCEKDQAIWRQVLRSGR